ncbi:hypothetical protein P8C59_007895 [Phyllachora maydis]|uniref:Threonylcarbamoyl-AMP synthase n=1 Tax=Phyllachora maydis TaxID=1825666 RepID=A0AAD9I9C4_9PEZI|nr:hypothetical protein P8C59_007895 [Phyllachora maydis]
MHTRVVKVRRGADLGHWAASSPPPHESQPAAASTQTSLDTWELPTGPQAAEDLAPLLEAARHLRDTDVPVAFPTETVYGLGADATRSAAVRGVFAAKGRPSDNPLIVHVCDLAMLRTLLGPPAAGPAHDPLPAIYRPLVARFWPGPLTILLPDGRPSRLAPEVTAGLPTFACRLPASALARTLVRLAGAPLAAPSANASTRPSPTAAAHVLHDLAGRIALVVDGGGAACAVGVESTVVDGLCDPPVVLRPGGVGIDELRACEGWEGVQKAYGDPREVVGVGGGEGKAEGPAPRAPGMKYKHYSPSARVVLYEAGYAEGAQGVVERDAQDVLAAKDGSRTIGIIRTRRWPPAGGLRCGRLAPAGIHAEEDGEGPAYTTQEGDLLSEDGQCTVGKVLDIDLGREAQGVAHGLFSALRALDRRGADVIFIDGLSDGPEDIGAAVMNRLRKAASDIRT